MRLPLLLGDGTVGRQAREEQLSTLAIKNGCKEPWLALSTNLPECCDGSCRGYRVPKWSLVVRVNQIRHHSTSALRWAAAAGGTATQWCHQERKFGPAVCVCVVWRARNPRGREINMISQPALKKFCLLVSVLHLSQLDPGFYITAGLLVWVPRVRLIQWSVKQIRILLRHDFKIWLASQIYQWCMFIQTHWDFSEKEKNILF